jgi:hypothetical protein
MVRVLIDASQGVNVEYLLRHNLADVGSATITFYKVDEQYSTRLLVNL